VADELTSSVRERLHRERMICRFDLDQTVPEWALAYEFEIVLRGRGATPLEV
jgi:protocatechuate 3,4-dioxygenase, beta subunit